jgi:hypothetical protein
MKRITPFIVIFLALTLCSGWGFLVHKTVQQLAVYELPDALQPFFYRNLENLVNNAVRPDIRRNDDSTEASKHFIDLEMYGSNAANKMPMDWASAQKKYSKDSLLKYGYVPYHIIYMKGKLTAAFASGNKDSILFYAADMGHYIADAHVPLHTTVNYDGQLTNQKGLHSLWESMIPELNLEDYHLYSSHRAVYLKKPEKAIWAAVRHAAALVPGMLEKEKQVSAGFTEEQKFRTQIRRGKESKSYTTAFAKAYALQLGLTINEQLVSSANMIADMWFTCWTDAGKPDLGPITTGWNADLKNRLEGDMKAFAEDKLLETKRLLSKKPETKEVE